MKHENSKPTWDDVTRGIEENVRKINELVDQLDREIETRETLGCVMGIIGLLTFVAFLFSLYL